MINNEQFANVFEENLAMYYQIEIETPEPKWEVVFIKRLPESHINDFIKMIQKPKYDKIPYFYFLRGLIHEYGITQKIDLEEALLSYKKGAESNDSYCLLKLYFIQRNHSSIFGLEKSRDLEMLYLIKSAAFFDYYSDERFKFYPVYQLAVHLDKEDNNVDKCHRLLKKFEGMEVQKLISNCNIYGSDSLEIDKKKKSVEFEFLNAWLSIRFYLSKEEQNVAYNKIKRIALENNYLEACFLLSELYVGHIEGGDEYDLSKAEKILKFCIENNLLKAYTSLASLYEKMNNYPRAIEYYFKAAKNGCYRGLYEYASFIICGYMTPINFRKGIKYFIKGFWLGYMYSADHLVLILNNSEYQKQNIFAEQDYKMCFDISLHLYKNYEFISSSFLKYGPQYYLVSICYEKGMHLHPPNLNKALEVLLEGEKDEAMKEKKYVLYRLGRIYYKKANMIMANTYYENAFHKYMEIIYDDKLTKYPAQYYRVAKLFENGWGVDKNLNLAIDFYKKGMNPSKYFFLLQHYYQNKCKKKYLALREKVPIKNFTLQKHSKQINDLIILGSNTVATAGVDSNIFIWDVKKKKLIRSIFKAHKGSIQNLSYSFSRNLISLGADHQLKVWSICNCKLIYSLDLKSMVNDVIDTNFLPNLSECYQNKLIIQLNVNKLKIFDIKRKKLLEETFPNVNLITSSLFLPIYDIWIAGDQMGYLNWAKFDEEFRILHSSRSLFHHKDVTNIIKFERFNKNYLMTCSYDSKICIILYIIKGNEIKLLLERKFTTNSSMDLKGLSFSNHFNSFFVGNCVGKIINFDKIFSEHLNLSSSQKKNEKRNTTNDPVINENHILDGHKCEIEKILVLDEKFVLSISAGRENFVRVWTLEFLKGQEMKGDFKKSLTDSFNTDNGGQNYL